MSHSHTESLTDRNFSVPESVASYITAAAMKEDSWSGDKAKMKLILDAAAAAHGLTFSLIDVNSSAENIKACAEVAQDLSDISDQVEKNIRRYKEESPLTSCLNEVIAELTAQYERYHVQEWIQELSDWTRAMKLFRNKYRVFLDTCVPRARRLGSWRQMAMAGGVTISTIAVGAGIWCFR